MTTLAEFAAEARKVKLCAVGRSIVREEIEAGLKDGVPYVVISGYLRAEGTPVSDVVIRRHGLGLCCCG